MLLNLLLVDLLLQPNQVDLIEIHENEYLYKYQFMDEKRKKTSPGGGAVDGRGVPTATT